MTCFLKFSSLVIFCIPFEEVSNPLMGRGGEARKTNYQETDVATGVRRNKTEVTEPILLRNGQITELNVAKAVFIFVKLRTQQTPCCQTTPSTEGLFYCTAKASIFYERMTHEHKFVLQ